MLSKLYTRHKLHWPDVRLAVGSLFSFAIFLFAIFVIQPYAIDFANEAATSPVGDIILSNTPVFDVGIFFVYGMFLLVLFITVLCLSHPNRIAFVLHSLTLFVLIRSAFVSLTHVGAFTTQAASDFGPAITRMFFGADHFFSGHTGAPFLMALIFWQYPALRYTFLGWSVFFGTIVLLGHLHYTIDVLAAFFITYGIFHIARWLLPRDWALFNQKA
ncbi:MAG TPA: phosphatase PAP2-related protein [Candidatus Paceibacterota bacterium]